MSSFTFWRSVNYGSLLIEEWEDGFTVFQPDSGKTHFINPLGMQMLADLHFTDRHPLTEEELCSKLATRLQIDLTPGFRAQIHSVILSFDQLGLIMQGTRVSSRDS